MQYATIDDITALFRPLTPQETERANALLPVVSARLRYEAKKVGKDLDHMVEEDPDLAETAKSVTVDVVARTLMTSTDMEPTTQCIFIKRDELAALGLRRQRYGVIDFYGSVSEGDPCDPVRPDADGD